jgi:hypothetical protein
MRPIERKFEYPFSRQGVASVGDSAHGHRIAGGDIHGETASTPRPAQPLKRSLPTFAKNLGKNPPLRTAYFREYATLFVVSRPSIYPDYLCSR